MGRILSSRGISLKGEPRMRGAWRSVVPTFPRIAVLGFFCRSQRAGLVGSCNPRDYPEVDAESAPSFLLTDHRFGDL